MPHDRPGIDGNTKNQTGRRRTIAYDFKVDWWDPDYSLEEKRRTLSDSWRVHKMLGTRAAVETAIRAIYPKTEVKEWFEYEGGKPYHFKLFIDLSGEKWSEARPRRVLERVEFYKSLHSHLEEFQFTSRPQEPAVLHMGGVLSSVISIPIPEQRDRFAFGDTLCLGGGTPPWPALQAGRRPAAGGGRK